MDADAGSDEIPAAETVIRGGVIQRHEPQSEETEGIPRHVDVLFLSLGGSSWGVGTRLGGGVTPWAFGPIVVGPRLILGFDGKLFESTGQGLVSLHGRAATGAGLGWTRREISAGAGITAWGRERDGRNSSGVSPSGEASLAGLFGSKGEVGLELRAEAIGLESYGVVLGLRAGGHL
jgi:hypothetical protein